MKTPANVRRCGLRLSDRRSIKRFVGLIDCDPRSVRDLVLAETTI